MLRSFKNSKRELLSLRGAVFATKQSHKRDCGSTFAYHPEQKSRDFAPPSAPLAKTGSSPRHDGGFSLVEAIVSSLIFATVVVGVFATMSSFKTPSVDADKKLMAAFYGKQVLEDLRAHVDQRDWDSPLGLLSNGEHPPSGVASYNITNPTYNVVYYYRYTVTNDANGARQVLLNLTWAD